MTQEQNLEQRALATHHNDKILARLMGWGVYGYIDRTHNSRLLRSFNENHQYDIGIGILV